MTSAIRKYTESNDPFERYALTRNAIEWGDSVNFAPDALRDNSSKVGKQIAGKVTEAAIASIAGSNGYSGHAATDWVVKHDYGGTAPDIDALQKSVRVFYQGVLKGEAQLFLPAAARKGEEPSLVVSKASISEDERNANFSVMMRRVVLQPDPEKMQSASGVVAKAAFVMLPKNDKQIEQYNKAIGKLQAELREKLKDTGKFKGVVLVNAGPLSGEVEALRKENVALREEIKDTKLLLQLETTITNDIQGELEVFQEKIVVIMDIMNKEPLDKKAVLENLRDLLAQE